MKFLIESLPKHYLTTLLTSAIVFLAGSIISQAQPGLSNAHPNLARGKGVNKEILKYDWDDINAFNGNLNISLTLGIQYPLTTVFNYQFSLTYNSNIWDLDGDSIVSASPVKYSNSGAGWDLSFGRLVAPVTSQGRWVYISPDGAYHPIYSTVHEYLAEDDPTDAVGYTRDGSYLRMRVLNGSTRLIESPDGIIRTFTLMNQEWKLTRIADLFTRFVTIAYSDNLWTLTDSLGRTHKVYFRSDPTGYYPALVDRVELAAFNGSTATYTLTYTTNVISRPILDTDPATSATVAIPLLSNITAPDGAKHDFHYHSSQFQDVSGRLAAMQLPTLGRVNWTYTNYFYTGGGRATNLGSLYRRNVGVGMRSLTDASGVEIGRWAYTPALNPDGSEEREFSNTVLTPVGDKTVYYFNVTTKSVLKAGYALPGTHKQFDASNTRILAEQVFDCDGAGGNCQLMRSRYVRYEQDIEPNPASAEVASISNRREASQRTVYHDDVENGVARFADIDRRDYDGLGHWRRITTNGNFGSADVRDYFIDYNAATGTYPSVGYRVPAPSAAWVTERYSQTKVVEGQSARIADYCFDSTNGFLKRVRRYKTTDPNGSAGPNDVLVVYEGSPAGQIIKERYYGADVQSIGTGSLCSLALPAVDQYQIRSTYQYGVLNDSQYFDESGQAFGPKTVDITIDKNTGLVGSSRDSAGIATNYEYDSMGRVIWVKPVGGHGAWIEFSYSLPTGTRPETGAKKTTYAATNGGGATLTGFEEVLDSFGRVGLEYKAMPDASSPEFPVWVSRRKIYNAMGWLTQESEYSTSAPAYRIYSDHDPFGRPRTVTPQDGAHHNVTYQYGGIRTEKETVQVATSYSTSTGQINEQPRSTIKIRDGYGRAWRVVKSVVDRFGTVRDIITTNRYDLSGNLLEVTRDGIRIGKLSAYDGREFLTREYIEENGREEILYQSIDAFGKARLTQRSYQSSFYPVFKADSTYDRAGRLVKVQDGNDPSKVLKEFIYAEANGTNDWRAGKLWKTLRYHHVGALLGQHGISTVAVSETYTYGGVGGRVSRYDVGFSDNLGRYEKFFHLYVYNDLGNPVETQYPNGDVNSSITVGRTRRVVNGYARGHLTSISGSFNAQNETWANSISYHPNGLASNVSRSNGVTDVVQNDPYALSRPLSVSTVGAKNRYTNLPDNLSSGDFQYDGDGNLAKAGTQYFVRPDTYTPITPAPSPTYQNSCESGWRDALGVVYAISDRQCNAKSFFYYTAGDRLYKEENGIHGRKIWYLWSSDGRLLTEHSTHHAHYQPWPSLWEYTRDYIYRGDFLLAYEDRRPGDATSPHKTHIHHGFGVPGIKTDKNGYRIE